MRAACWTRGAVRRVCIGWMLAHGAGCAVMNGSELASDAEAEVVVAALPLGAAGIHYAGEGGEDALRWGPAALRVANDGSFWVVDGVADRLVHMSHAGAWIGSVDLSSDVVGAADVLVRDADLFVLDLAAMWPRVIRYTHDGAVLGSYALPAELESAVDGFLPSGDGRVLLHAGGVAVSELDLRSGEPSFSRSLDAYVYAGHAYGLAFPDAQAEDEIGHRVNVQVGSHTLQIESEYFVSSVRVLRVLENGESFVSMEEVAFDPRVLVDATVLHIDAQGRLLGRARLPVEDQHVFVRHSAAIDEVGHLYVLATREDGAEIRQLQWQSELEDVLARRIEADREREAHDEPEDLDASAPELEDADVHALGQALSTCRSPQQMMDKGFEYVNSLTWLAKGNLDRAKAKCTGRGVPKYLSTASLSAAAVLPSRCAGSKPGAGYECSRSVPYDWGGADTLAMYRAAIGRGLQAGDVNTSLPAAAKGTPGIESCSHGTDCSGFVTRAWDVSAYYPKVSRLTTKSLPAYSVSLSAGARSHPGCSVGQPSMAAPNRTPGCRNTKVVPQMGDILLKAGSHVTMFRKFAVATEKIRDPKTGKHITGRFPHHFESTAASSYGRVIYMHWPWSRFDTYEPRRFKQVCR